MANPLNEWFSGTSAGTTGQSPIDGLNAATINTGGKLVYQDENLVIQPTVIYRLTALAGQRIGVPFGTGSIRLLAETELLVEAFPNPPQDKFIAISLTYTSPPSGTAIGKPLRIELQSEGPNAQAWFDNLHLYTEVSVCTPHKATATARLVNGIFVEGRITDPGCGYTNTPTVLIEGGGGTGATARALISEGQVTEIRVTNGGCCYTNTPRIVISSPPLIPTVSITVSKVNVAQRNLVRGWKYVLESSTNNIHWTAAGPEFVVESETITDEFSVDDFGRFFRLRVVP